MFNTKCGCPYCKGKAPPTTRGGWKALTNSHGKPYGSFKKPGAKH